MSRGLGIFSYKSGPWVGRGGGSNKGHQQGKEPRTEVSEEQDLKPGEEQLEEAAGVLKAPELRKLSL